jgi:hypothetical protein
MLIWIKSTNKKQCYPPYPEDAMVHDLQLRLLIAYRMRGQLLYELQRNCGLAGEYLAIIRLHQIRLADAEVCINLYLRWNEVMQEMARARTIPTTPTAALALLRPNDRARMAA